MALENTTVVIEGSGSQPTPGQETQSSQTPGQLEQAIRAEEPDSYLTVKEQEHASGPSDIFAAEIEALKIKISEIEKRAQSDTAVRDSDGAAPQEQIDPESENARPGSISDMEQFRKMTEFLYNHRKQWETSGGPKTWGAEPKYRESPNYSDTRSHNRLERGPWNYRWMIYSRPPYYRPNPFDYNDQETIAPDTGDEMDRYDIEIDFGAAKDRIRRNFEWEMDRLFLAEETSLRKLAKEKEKEDVKSRKVKEEEKAKLDEELARPTCAQLKLNLVDWFVFKRFSQSEERDSCVIDVLIGEPVINNDVRTGWSSPSKRRIRKAVELQHPEISESLAPGQAPLPERIRIHSLALRKILYKILGEEASAITTARYKAAVLVRPFKALLYGEQALRSWCNNLEEKIRQTSKAAKYTPIDRTSAVQGNESNQGYGSSEADQVPMTHVKNVEQSTTQAVKDKIKEANTDSSREDDSETDDEEAGEKKEDPDDITQSTMALDHLKCLLNFVDTNILAKKDYLNSPTCNKIFFSDLWYLFRPGLVVIGRDGKQAYRVVNVTTTHHRVVPSWETWFWNSGDNKGKKKQAPFSTTCVYIDFDGVNLGPVSKTFEFKRFEGEMDITSLPVYPLRFHPLKKSDFSESEWNEVMLLPPKKRYMQKLINRGTKFLDVVGVKAMYYTGPTLGVRDDVESQVVIDFETAFSADDEKQQEWKPSLEVLLGNPVPEDTDDDQDTDPRCSAACCRGELVHDDTYVDLKARSDYVNDLLPKTGGLNEQPSVAIIPQPLRELRNGPGKNDYAVTDDERVIMSYRVFGFILRSRQWAQLDLSYLTELHSTGGVTRNKQEDQNPQEARKENQKYETAFGRLVLEQGQKPMIQALVAQHFRDKESKTGQAAQVDIVKGKGKGLILLLHGAPGVGKTSTAEGVAELFRKPLFQITCGDLGSTAKDVEKALDVNFTLANRWDCILLLDEADVFLAQRNKEDFIRNGLVAVFLRVLEYYAGVLFLTTNRVGDFDEAFTSRIHVSLYYPALNHEKTVEVFKINIELIKERFKDKKRIIIIDDIITFALDHFFKHTQARWNGRQIRNACQTALALAEFEAQGNSHETVLKPDAIIHLKVSHFQTVQKAYLEFADYMNALYGSTSSTRAKEGKVRAIWIDENDNIVGTQDMNGAFKSKQKAFLSASQAKQNQPVQPEAQFQQAFQQQVPSHPQPGFQQQAFPSANQGIQNPGIQQYYQYPNVVAPQPVYTQMPVQMQPQQQSFTGQQWGVQESNLFSSSGTGQADGQNRTTIQQPSTTSPPQQPPQQQTQPNPARYDQNTQANYEAGSQQGSEQRPAGNLPSPGSSAPGQQWQGYQGPASNH